MSPFVIELITFPVNHQSTLAHSTSISNPPSSFFVVNPHDCNPSSIVRYISSYVNHFVDLLSNLSNTSRKHSLITWSLANSIRSSSQYILHTFFVYMSLIEPCNVFRRCVLHPGPLLFKLNLMPILIVIHYPLLPFHLANSHWFQVFVLYK